MNLRDMYKHIRQREIFLYGKREEIELFLIRYGEKLNIRQIITDYQEEIVLQPYEKWGLETVLFDDAIFDDKFIIICHKYGFHVMQKRLQYNGYRAYKDYISQELVEALLFQKKLIVCMGTHLLGQVSFLLGTSEELTEQYSIVYFAESELYNSYRDRMQEYFHVCKVCNVYIRSSCEKKNFEMKICKQEDLVPQCIVITVADYCFGGYYPQLVCDRNMISDYLLRERERLEISYETVAFARTDFEMESRCISRTDKEIIVSQLMDEGFYTTSEVKEHFDYELKRFKTLEVNDDIKLGDFIEKNYCLGLCHNLNEWNEPVVSYVTNSILGMLDIPELVALEGHTEQLIKEHVGSEIVIYPSVYRALELKTNIMAKKYKVVTYYNERYLSTEEYMCFLVDYLNMAIEFVEFTGMNNLHEVKRRNHDN